MTVKHLFSYEHSLKFPKYDKDKLNATACGYVRKNITSDITKVNCSKCLKEWLKNMESEGC